MSKPDEFNFWYAVNNTRIVVMPSRRLETFGVTVLNYHLISELMDAVDKIRIREGRIQAYRPEIITPDSFARTLLEGFGEEAQQYMDWLREHASDLRILRYGFAIRKQSISEQVVTDKLEAVVERIEKAVRSRDDPLAAVVVGVESPWEVSLLKMLVEVSSVSFPGNVRELERYGKFAAQDPKRMVREEIEAEFRAAAQDRSRIRRLARLLREAGLFGEYEDRFFALLRSRG